MTMRAPRADALQPRALDLARSARMARDEICRRFAHVQAASSLRDKLPAPLDAVYENVLDSARAVLARSGHDFDAPTLPALVHLVAGLVRKGHGWGAPQDALDATTQEIGRIMDALND
ncbi:MAG: hypothetical protein AB7K09_08585 [Planctomycetota bacterium]